LKKWLLILLATGVLAGLALWLALGGVSGVETKNASSVGGWPRTAPSVVLVVLDTVRADHLSACGYARPTSPFTEELFASAEFATCHAYSPGSWTLPSHASFFTGLPVQEHGADAASRGDVSLPWGTRFTPLSERFATLAEKLSEEGYRTVLVSGNPVLNEASGLTRGFDHAKVAESFGQTYGDALVREVRRQLDAAPPDEPLLLVVNIADAHNPWHPIPDDLGWAPPQPGLDVSIQDNSPWVHYVRGTLPPKQTERARAHYTDVYDYGVFRADRTLAGVFVAMRDYQVLSNDYRIVVTSDHGELLLEHDSFGHGGHLWEASVRVPFVFLSNGTVPGNPSEPFAAIEAHRLLLGDAPLDVPVTATGNRRHRLSAFFGDGYPQFRERAVALWKSRRHKLLMRDNRVELYDIEADPNEETPLPLEDERLVERLGEIARQAAENDMTAEVSEELQEQLRALGYAE
jgi:arylsulfatase A-like enzyme